MNGRRVDAHAVTWDAGLRQVRPSGRLFPAWFDIYPNSELVQQVEAPVCVLHVSAPLLQCSHAHQRPLHICPIASLLQPGKGSIR